MRPLPTIDLKDRLVCQSPHSGFAGLSVLVYDLPAYGRAVCQEENGFFIYWPWAGQGELWLTARRLGLIRHPVHGERSLLVPPRMSVCAEWARACGRVAMFLFFPRFLEARGADAGRPRPGGEAPRAVFFSLVPPLDALCRLLMKETETHCRLGPRYFEGLACALGAALVAVPDGPACVERRAVAVPPGVWRALRWLEARFAHEVWLEDLAAQAGLSPRHFARCFQQATGCTAHQYLLRVRLNHACRLLAQRAEARSLAEVAEACGFCDQAHLGRHFRRAFGTTPAAFQKAEGGWERPPKGPP
jgi:AraC-like DNA-binding protein